MALIWPYVLLIILGCGWGLTIPLTVISVRNGFGHLGIIFWQFFIIMVVFGLRQIFLNKKLSLARSSLRVFCVIAFIGTIFPNSASLIAASYLPGGILSILIATVPMFAFPIALLFGIDKFGFLRLLGIIFGFLGVYLLIAPKAALPDPSVVWVIPIALIAPMFYGLEGNFVAHYAILFSSVIHGVVYATYVWLVTKVGSVFSAQVSYFVTLAGVLWSMLMLGEVHSKFIWMSLACMILGMALVKPRSQQN